MAASSLDVGTSFKEPFDFRKSHAPLVRSESCKASKFNHEVVMAVWIEQDGSRPLYGVKKYVEIDAWWNKLRLAFDGELQESGHHHGRKRSKGALGFPWGVLFRE